MFDISQPIHIDHLTSNGKVEFEVKVPTDDQWVEYQKKVKIVTQELGRGKSTSDAPNRSSAAAELFDDIVVTPAALDENEKEQVINRLKKFLIKSAVAEGPDLVVTMEVPGGETKHTLKIPSAKRLKEFERGHLRAIAEKHGRSEIRVNLRAAGDLYDDCVVSVAGYSNPDAVPIVHKGNVVAEVVDLLGEINKKDDLTAF